jgi:hypothetical protein
MSKSATDVMHDLIVSAIVDAIAALKAGSGGLPNTLLRDINAVHSNTAFADLPPALRESIAASVRAAFMRLMREGYAVAPRQPVPPPTPRRDNPDAKPTGARDNRGRGDGRPRGPGRSAGGRPPGGKPGGGKPRSGHRRGG